MCVCVCVCVCVCAENVNLEKIKDEKERREVESLINNFGQTPTQLFTEPHPQRLSLKDSRSRSLGKTFGRRANYNLFDYLELMKTHCVKVSWREREGGR